MQKVIRLGLVSLLAITGSAGICAAQDMNGALTTTKPVTISNRPLKPAEYRRADANFYPRTDLLKADPGAVVIAKEKYSQTGDSYFFTPRIRAPMVLYGEMLSDWIEPITPPDMHPLGVPPDAMQIREPQGDVEVALPGAPASFTPVTDGMTLPNGAVVKTGANGTAAVLFGGVDSARLMPDSAAAVQQTVAAQSRSAEVDLTAGGVFSKVGTQVGVKGEYAVHTPLGNASTEGGDFVTIIANSRVDVWGAQGTTQLAPPEGKAMVMISDGTGPLKIMRLPQSSDPQQALAADVETFTAILNFIPLANQKIKALRDKAAAGTALTANEQAYLGRIKQVPSLIKLALVPPPAPPAPPPLARPEPHLALNRAESAPVLPPPSAPPPAPVVPVTLDLRSDGGVALNGILTSPDDLKSRLGDLAKANPTQLILITGREKVTHDQLKKVIEVCHQAKLKVKVAKAAPVPKPVAAQAPAASPSPISMAVPAPTIENPPPAPVAPKVEAPTINPPPMATPPAAEASTPAAPAPETSTPATNAAPAVPAPAPAPLKPMKAVVRVDGKINFQGATYELPGFKLKLEQIVKATPDQPIVIKAGKNVAYSNVQAAKDVCDQANVKNVTVAVPPPAPGSPAATTAAPVAAAPAEPAMPATPAAEATPATPAAASTTAATAASASAMKIVVRTDGKVNFQGATYDLPGFKAKLEKIIAATPDQEFVLRANSLVPYDKVKAVLDVCNQAPVKHLDVAASALPPSTSSTGNLPGPSLRLGTSPAPVSEPADATPAAPATNAAPATGP